MLIEEVSEKYGLKHVGNIAVLCKVPPISGAQNGHSTTWFCFNCRVDCGHLLNWQEWISLFNFGHVASCAVTDRALAAPVQHENMNAALYHLAVKHGCSTGGRAIITQTPLNYSVQSKYVGVLYPPPCCDRARALTGLYLWQPFHSWMLKLKCVVRCTEILA